MVVSARLSHTLHQTLGDEAAEDLVNWMERVDANRSELREYMELHLARLDDRLTEERLRNDARFVEERRWAEAQFSEMRLVVETGFARMDGRFERLEAAFDSKIDRRFFDLLRWSLVFWVGAVGAIAALAVALK